MPDGRESNIAEWQKHERLKTIHCGNELMGVGSVSFSSFLLTRELNSNDCDKLTAAIAYYEYEERGAIHMNKKTPNQISASISVFPIVIA